MYFDIELIRKVYGSFAARVEQARKVKGTSLTLAEKSSMRTCTMRRMRKRSAEGSIT